CSRGGLPSYYW
nr:immunoglobulin heavy chain junction region [Mus musculus]